MKSRYKITIVLFLSIIVLLNSMRLEKTHDRQNTYQLPASLRQQICSETVGMNEDEIKDYALHYTASKLRFTLKNNINAGEANCIGYAQMCSAVCNEAYRANNMASCAKPVVGYVECFGVNLCKVAKCFSFTSHMKAFVKDHDFVEIKTSGKTYYFDPSIYDVFGINCYTKKS